MQLFTVDTKGKFEKFEEKSFHLENTELDLEDLLEKNPDYFFSENKILIIGRQVVTNLRAIVDLLGVDDHGNIIVIELKRDKTPRESIAQLLEYASYVDNLDYAELNEIFQQYTDEEVELEEYHSEYFGHHETSHSVSWNKSMKMLIIAQHITPEIKQTALFLRRKGIEVYCAEFKYFKNKAENRIISSDFIVGDEDYYKGGKPVSGKIQKTDKETFLNNIDKNGQEVFARLFDFAERENLLIRWGNKGFSLNVKEENVFVGFLFGYPLDCPYSQSVITGFKQIEKKTPDSATIIGYYRSEIQKLDLFTENVGFFGNPELKWLINRPVNQEKINRFMGILAEMVKKIKQQLTN